MATIRKRGNKYQVQIRRKGQSPVSRSFIVRKDAETWARQMEVQADRHDLPVDLKSLARISLRDLVERYRDTVTAKKKRRETETIVLNAFLRHPICRKTLLELQTADFAGYRDQRLNTVAPATLKRELVTVQNLFEVARKEWGVPLRRNPVQELGFKVSDQRRERRLRDGEWERLIEAAKSRKNPYVVPIIIIAVETAMRRGEILAIKWERFDSERRSLFIPHSKNGHARTIPLSAKSVIALLEVRDKRLGISISNGILDDNIRGKIVGSDEAELIFPISPNAFRLAWERVKVGAGIGDLHFHDLRHEAISRFFEMGLTAPEVALISGHRDIRMLFRYTHPLQENIRAKFDHSHA